MLRYRFVLLALVLPAASFGWGFTAHRRLASMMQDPLPANLCLKTWLNQHQTNALQDSACDPDRWRYTDSAMYDPDEWPRHYLEVDRINPPAAYPREWADVVTTFGRYADKNGKVPFRVEELYGQLVTAFRATNTTEILRLAFLMSHYVTDSFSLLHNTLNFDPNGVHSRWESDMFAVSAQANAIAALAPTYYGTVGRLDPRYAIFDTVIVGTAQAPALIAADPANPQMPAFYAAVKDMTARRWGDALTVLSSLIWQAWADAGSPELTGFSGSCLRTVPTAGANVIGFPVPGGFTSRDGGYQAPDASVVDAGYDDGDGGQPNDPEDGGTGGGSGTGGGTAATGGSGFGGMLLDAGFGDTPAPTCGCGSAGGLGLLLISALGLLRRRTR